MEGGVDLTIDAATLAPMLGRMDVYKALLDSLQERRGAHESSHVLQLRLKRALQGHDLTVRLQNAGRRVPAELAFFERTVAEVHPRPRVVLDAPAPGRAPAAAGPAGSGPPRPGLAPFG